MDLTSIQTLKYINQKYGFRTSKGLGQNFLTDSSVIDAIVNAAEIGEGTGVLEIGPGIGVLTHALSAAAKKVVAIEIDTRLIDVLSETLEDCDNVDIVNADVLKTDIPALIAERFSNCESVSIAANLPYYITTPIITGLLENESLSVKNIVVMVQKEVAQRLCAPPGKKDCGALSVLISYHTEPEMVAHVPSSKFVPVPKVDSAVVRMRMRSEKAVAPKSEEMLFKTVKASFGQRRKTLLNALCGSGMFGRTKDELKVIIAELGFGESVRGEQLAIEQFCALADRLLEN